MAFFSIIIPLYNKENFIEKTIQSVLNQTFQDFEILIINDGSTDRSEEKLFQFKDSRILYYYQLNSGASSARNSGIKKSSSANFITFLDADDYWYPDFLKIMYDAIELFPEQKVYAAAIEIETSKKIIDAQYSIPKTANFEIVNYFKASLKESVICTSCSVFEKTIFNEIGNFDPSIKSGQDTDLWIRIGIVYPVLFSSKILARYVYDPKSLSRNPDFIHTKMDFSKFTALEKTNPDLKKFLDLNRFSLAIKSKISNQNLLFEKHYNNIDSKNLNLKKRILLHLPPFLLKVLINLKTNLAHVGLGSSVFK